MLSFMCYVCVRCDWSVWPWTHGLCHEGQPATDLEELLHPGGTDAGGGHSHAHSWSGAQVRITINMEFHIINIGNLTIQMQTWRKLSWYEYNFCSALLLELQATLIDLLITCAKIWKLVNASEPTILLKVYYYKKKKGLRGY